MLCRKPHGQYSTFIWQRPDGCAHGKVGHVGQEGIDLDHLLDGRAGLLEDSLEVGNAGGRLLLDGALDQVALGVTGNLARAVDGSMGLNGLGLLNLSEGGSRASCNVEQQHT